MVDGRIVSLTNQIKPKILHDVIYPEFICSEGPDHDQNNT